jgi:hypothetical protein
MSSSYADHGDRGNSGKHGHIVKYKMASPVEDVLGDKMELLAGPGEDFWHHAWKLALSHARVFGM